MLDEDPQDAKPHHRCNSVFPCAPCPAHMPQRSRIPRHWRCRHLHLDVLFRRKIAGYHCRPSIEFFSSADLRFVGHPEVITSIRSRASLSAHAAPDQASQRAQTRVRAEPVDSHPVRTRSYR